MPHTEPLSLQFSARVFLFQKFSYIIYPIILYSTLFILVSHKSFHVGYYIASFIIFIVLIIAHYEQLSQLTRLAIKNDFWKLSIQNDTLKYYNPHKKKTFQIHLSKINNVHRNPSELKITLLTAKDKIDIEIPMESALTEIQTLLEDLGVNSIFKQGIEKRELFDKKLKSQTQFYFHKSSGSLIFNSLTSLIVLFGSIIIMISFVQDPFFERTHFIFALVWFIFFWHTCKELERFFTLLKGGTWDIILIDSKLIWNTPKAIKGSFVLNLFDIEEVICSIVKDSESGDSYHYHIKLKSGERIDLDDSSKVSLSELAPLLGKFRRIWS